MKSIPANSARLAIQRRIAERGRITFAEFMELALYHPIGGYYRKSGRISAQGDFYTSPSLHPAFGALLAISLRSMWQRLGEPRRFDVIELGAGSGLLGRDILRYARHLGESFAQALRYVSLDRAFGPGADRFNPETLVRPVTGCVLSNELLDAFPVHRFEVREGRLREIYVTLDDGEFAEVLDSPSTPDIECALAEVLPGLPDGYRGEVNLGLAPWAARVRQLLERGFVVTIDFGHDARTLYQPGRERGTLRCYYRHTLSANPFQHIGDQDIAAHVDFTALSRALEHQGLHSLGVVTQHEFLNTLGFHSFFARIGRDLPADRALGSNRRAMLDLVQPDGFGEFLVDIHATHPDLVSSLGQLYDSAETVAQHAPLPLLDRDPDRMDLLDASPSSGYEFSLSWEELVSPD